MSRISDARYRRGWHSEPSDCDEVVVGGSGARGEGGGVVVPLAEVPCYPWLE